MRRREWIGAVTAGGVGACLTRESAFATASSVVSLTTEIVRLRLRHTWTTASSTSDYRDVLYVRFAREGVEGIGEGAPIARYGETAVRAREAVESVRDLLTSSDPWMFEKIVGELHGRIEGEYAAKAAVEIALMDWVTKRLGVPLYRYFGLDPSDAPATTFSIGIDSPETTRAKVLEADAYPVLKVKVGLENDEATIDAIRSETAKPLRVDANEGWKTKEEAARKIAWLESQGVELVEQPLPATAPLDDVRWVRERVHIPIFADESCLRPADVARLAGSYDGVNIKLDKAGGVLQAYRMILIARSLGLRTMLGCMISSSVSVTAAAHLSPLVDVADLDGNLLIANDPFRGVEVREGRMILPSGPGLGLRPA